MYSLGECRSGSGKVPPGTPFMSDAPPGTLSPVVLEETDQATHCLDLESETSSSDHLDHIRGRDKTPCPA